MTEGQTKPEGRRAFAWRVALALVATIALMLTLAACDDGGAESYTPPPATIIRADDSAATPTAPAQDAPPTVPMPPTMPAQQSVGSGQGTPYPPPVYAPAESPTPVVYPTK